MTVVRADNSHSSDDSSFKAVDQNLEKCRMVNTILFLGGGARTFRVEVGWDNGVVVMSRDSAICFDPSSINTQYRHIFISHAHSDHTAGFMAGRSEKYSTPATAAIFEAMTGRTVGRLKTLNYGEKVKVGDFEITAHNAGHILGSALYMVDTGEETVLYTGDINCVDTVVTRAAEEVHCDVLVLESTYGSPDFLFPPREEIYKDLVEWVVSEAWSDAPPAFYVYPVGKSQEIIKLVNHFTEIPVVVDPRIARVNEVYSSFGVKLNAAIDDGSSNKSKRGCLVVKPRRLFDPSRPEPGVTPAMATGWALRFRRANRSFPLSSHADFYQLLSYVRHVKPKIVYTSLGMNGELASQIRKKIGVEAQPLKNLTKQCLHSNSFG
ncbi:MAG: MBL fold metallo-hydrolase [Candidatus Bathyarchaeia archaeon]